MTAEIDLALAQRRIEALENQIKDLTRERKVLEAKAAGYEQLYRAMKRLAPAHPDEVTGEARRESG